MIDVDITSQEAAVVYGLCHCFSRGAQQNHDKPRRVQLRKQIPRFLIYLFVYLFTATF